MLFTLWLTACWSRILLVRTMSLYETFHKSWDPLGKDKAIETFAMALSGADGINVKKMPSPASQHKPKDTVCQEQFEVVT